MESNGVPFEFFNSIKNIIIYLNIQLRNSITVVFTHLLNETVVNHGFPLLNLQFPSVVF